MTTINATPSAATFYVSPASTSVSPATEEPSSDTTSGQTTTGSGTSTLTSSQTLASYDAITYQEVSTDDADHIRALTTTQIRQLTAEDLAAFSASELQALTAPQIAALSATQIQDLSGTQIEAFSPGQVKSFATSVLAGFSDSQFSHFGSDDISSLTSLQVKGRVGMEAVHGGCERKLCSSTLTGHELSARTARPMRKTQPSSSMRETRAKAKRKGTIDQKKKNCDTSRKPCASCEIRFASLPSENRESAARDRRHG